MSSIEDNQIHPLTHDQMELVRAAAASRRSRSRRFMEARSTRRSFRPGVGTPTATPLFGMTRSGPLM